MGGMYRNRYPKDSHRNSGTTSSVATRALETGPASTGSLEVVATAFSAFAPVGTPVIAVASCNGLSALAALLLLEVAVTVAETTVAVCHLIVLKDVFRALPHSGSIVIARHDGS